MKYNFNNKFFANVFLNAVLFSVIGLSAARHKCDEEALLRCTYPLQALTGNADLGFAAKKEELDELCSSLHSGLQCIDGYTRRCFTDEKRAHFNRLYSGSSMVMQELCQEGEYQKEFLEHAPCMRLVKNEYDDCANHYTQLIQEINTPGRNNGSTKQEVAEMHMRTICCSFQDFLHCSENVVMERCGEETAKFTHNFLNRMSSSLIKDLCQSYLPSCLDAISGAFSSSEVLLSNWLLLFLVNFALLLNIFKSRT